MSNLIILLLISAALALCFVKWRLGVLISVIVGFLQDPLRKLVPGEPVYLTVAVVAFILVTYVGARARGVRLRLDTIYKWHPKLRVPLQLFVCLIALQSAAALVRTDSFNIAAVGLVAYLSPLPAVLLAYRYGRSEVNINKLYKIYAITAALMLSGVYLSYAGYQWRLLESVGAGLTIFLPTGESVALPPGFLRGPEVAAWHAATAISLIVILAMISRKGRFPLPSVGAVIFLLVALLFTGRRKFFIEILLFGLIYYALLVWFRRGDFKRFLLVVVGVFICFISYTYLLPGDFKADVDVYAERTTSVGSEVTDRTYNLTVDSLGFILAQNGFWGSGAGTGSQGAQHFGGGSDFVGLAAEGGLGKLLAELGVPGLLIISFLVFSCGQAVWTVLIRTREHDDSLFRLASGLTALLVANASIYVVAHQIFGDPFVLVLLGFMFGNILSLPEVAARQYSSGDSRNIILRQMSPQAASQGVNAIRTQP